MFEAFRDDAQAYCDFIDVWRAGQCREPFTDALRLLSNLAKSGLALPFVMAEKDVEDVERIDHAHWQVLAAEINELTGAACAALFNLKDELGIKGEEVGCYMLFDDLTDIYRDLRHGLDLYAIGDPEHVAEAVYQWRFGYENHWGQHLFRALATIHEIRYRLFMD